LPQHAVPDGHASVPELPWQSTAFVPELQVVWQLEGNVNEAALTQQFWPALHVYRPPSAARHSGGAHAPAEQYVGHCGPLFCQVPVELHVCGWNVPLHCFCVGAHDPEHDPLTQVWLLAVQEAPTTQLPEELQVSG
jgi:hypothetical protein